MFQNLNLKKFRPIFLLAILVIIIFVFQKQLHNAKNQFILAYFPCRYPITYSVGQFDTQFGLSKGDFLKATTEAESIWDQAIGRKLFAYQVTDGDLKINLIYDYRQEATNAQTDIASSIDQKKESYNFLKAKYDSLFKEYSALKADYNSKAAAFTQAQNSYNQEVGSLNKKSGGVSKNQIEKLSQESAALKQQFAEVKISENHLNEKGSEVNAIIPDLRNAAQAINMSVDEFNQVGNSVGSEFEEGVYKSSAAGKEIDIFQFDSNERMIRVLAHELGHALGLEHVQDPDAIMYELNQSANSKLTVDDLSALKARCGIK